MNHTPNSSDSTVPAYSPLAVIRTVAEREIHNALRSKALIISVAIALIGIAAGIGVSIFLDNKQQEESTETPTLAVVGVAAEIAPAAHSNITIHPAPNRDAAVQEVRDGAAAALVKTDKGYELLSAGESDPNIVQIASHVAQQDALHVALDRLHVSPEKFAQSLPPAHVLPVNLDEQADDSANNSPWDTQGATLITALVGVSIMGYFIMLFAGNIGGRVMEEKSSRVAEIILGSVRPLHFLTGKLVGNAIFGFASSLLVLGIGLAGLQLSNTLPADMIDWKVLPLLLLNFILGFLFFGSVYAAAGSMVSRTEDMQSTQTPILLLFFVMFYAPWIGINFLDTTAIKVLSWIPPFSLSLSPLRWALGEISLFTVALNCVLCLVVTALMMGVMARIYRRAIIYTGNKLTWRAVLRRAA